MFQMLIIDDDKELCQLLEDYFRPEHITCRFAHDGQSGLAAILEERPDMVILDVMLPEKNGFEVLRAIRRDTRLSRLPVIMLTARGDFSDRVRGLDAGADDYLPKPFNPRELLSRVRAVMRAFCSTYRTSSSAFPRARGDAPRPAFRRRGRGRHTPGGRFHEGLAWG